MAEILPTMTVQEAAAIWDDPRRSHLGKWEREFNQPLKGLHSGHVITYQNERRREVDAAQVNLEVDALRALLKEAGCGEEIERYYSPLKENVTLTAEEMDALPGRVQTYIRELREHISDLQRGSDRTKDKLRKANWARWNRER